MTLDVRPSDARNRLGIHTLTAADVDRLRFSVWSRTSNEVVKAAIANYPGRSVWVPDTLEYAVVASWRHRPEIANVLELSAVNHPAELLRQVVQRASDHEAAMVLSVEIDESRQPAFYERAGFSLLEDVMTYELDAREWRPAPAGGLIYCAANPTQAGDLAALLDLDHLTFPWLWWNSADEFTAYADSPRVELFLVSEPAAPIGYIGLTAYFGWGHLDRIAIHPSEQGRGLGREALQFVIERLVGAGARRVGLSTQRQNERSRRLYERAGFRHIVANDYRLYGRILRLPSGVSSATELI